jgi:hypothetical protein
MADSPDDLYRPAKLFGGANSFERQRVVGELDVSELNVTSFKDAVVWREGQEEEALRKIRDALNADPNPLLKMAKNFRASDNSKAGKAKLQGSLSDVVEAATKALIGGNAADTLGDSFENLSTDETPEPPRNSDTAVIQKIIRLIPQFNSDIILEVKDQIADTSWLRVRQDAELNKWIITINREHPFMKSFTVADSDSLEPVLRIALAIGIAEIQGLNSGFDTAGFLRLSINDLLRNYLSSRTDVDMIFEEDDSHWR